MLFRQDNWGANNYITFLIRWTWDVLNERIRRLLNEENIELFFFLELSQWVTCSSKHSVKNLRFFKIINLSYLQLRGLTCFYLCKALDISLSVILCWTCVSKRGMYCCYLGVCLCNLSTWSYMGTVCLSWFQTSADSVWSLLYNIILDHSNIPTCVVYLSSVICQVYLSENYISIVILPPNYTSLPFIVATLSHNMLHGSDATIWVFCLP